MPSDRHRPIRSQGWHHSQPHLARPANNLPLAQVTSDLTQLFTATNEFVGTMHQRNVRPPNKRGPLTRSWILLPEPSTSTPFRTTSLEVDPKRRLYVVNYVGDTLRVDANDRDPLSEPWVQDLHTLLGGRNFHLSLNELRESIARITG